MISKDQHVIGCGLSEDCAHVTQLFLEHPSARPEIEKEGNEVISFANKLLIANYQKKKIKNSVGTWLTFRKFDIILFGIFPPKYPDEVAERFVAEFSDSYNDFTEDNDAGRLKFSAFNLMSKYSNVSKVKKEMFTKSKLQLSSTELNRIIDTDNDITTVTETERVKGSGANRSVDRSVPKGPMDKNAKSKVFKVVVLIVFGALLVTMVITLVALI